MSDAVGVLSNPATGLVDRAEPADAAGRICAVLGVRIADLSKPDAIARLDRMLARHDHRARSIFFVNAHTLNLTVDDPRFREVLNSADLVLNDGTGVRWAARQRGIRLQDNLCGTDFVPDFLAATSQRGYRYYLLGADPASVRRAAQTAQERFPGWTLAGYHHGYINEAQSAAVVQRINASGAHLLLVGMGNPLQERWIHRHQPALRVPLCIGVGGLFDHWSGDVPRAPAWVRRLGYEWLHKLLHQREKWRRYLIGNPKFLLRITAAWHSDRQMIEAANAPRD